MADSSLPYYLCFSYCPGIGPTRFDALLTHFGSAKAAYDASLQELSSVIGTIFAQKFVAYRASFDFEKEQAKLTKDGITIVTREDSRFPQAILEISDPPICLFVKGDLSNFHWNDREKDELYIGVVGTRTPTSYGRSVSVKFARELSEAGAVVVSGMALGVDAYAHGGALDAGGRTVAFLGCGVNIIYPWVNRDLYHRIIDSGSLIISEFPPDKTTLKGHFVARNRLISGLSQGVLVAEGLKDSGSLITARYALAQGKDVFAPPAPITSSQSQAPNLLLKEGAKLVTAVSDILEEYGKKQYPRSEHDMPKLTEEQKRLYQLLSREAFLPDELARTLHVPVFQVLTLLSGMEISGVVEKNEAGKYQVVG